MGSDPTLISAQPPPAKINAGAAYKSAGADEGVTPQSALPLAAAFSDDSRVSKGERMFNWLTYGGFAGAVTFLLSLPLGYWARYSKGGQNTIKWAAHKIEPLGLSEHSAEDFVMTTSLMQGGNIALIPVKIMESQKAEVIGKINKKLGDSCEAEEVENGPKQSWGSLLKSRVVAWCAVYFSLRGVAQVAGKEKFNEFEHAFSRDLVCKPLGRPTHVNGMETTLYRYGRVAAIDLFASAAAGALLFIGSRIFGNRHKETPHATAVTPRVDSISAESSVQEPVLPPTRHSERFTRAESFVQQQALQAENGPALAP